MIKRSEIFSGIKVFLDIISNNNSPKTNINGKFQKQKQGLPMGNTLSPILADLYMNDYMEKTTIKSWRYVDDIFIIIKMNEEEFNLFAKGSKNLIKLKIEVFCSYPNKIQLWRKIVLYINEYNNITQ